MIEDGGRDAGVGVGDLLDLIGQPQDHLRQQLSVGLEDVGRVTLGAGTEEGAAPPLRVPPGSAQPSSPEKPSSKARTPHIQQTCSQNRNGWRETARCL